MFEFTQSPRIKRSPFHDAIVEEGVKSFYPYNNMFLPTGYGNPEEEYWRLINSVSMWDVACQRQIEIKGPDSEKLTQVLCPRDLSKFSEGQGKYIPICNHDGVIINDPVVLKHNDRKFWLSIADSNILFWSRAIANERKFNVQINEADASPLAVQGPKAVDVISSIFGDWVKEIKYHWFEEATIDGIPILIARSGWSKQGGYELYLLDRNKGKHLWKIVREAGKVWDIGPGYPNVSERIESGLLSWGGDTDDSTNPFEVRLGKYLDLDLDDDVIGIKELRRIKQEGPKRHQLGIILDNEQKSESHGQWYDILSGKNKVGDMTCGVWSKRLKKNIGFALISVDCSVGEEVKVLKSDKTINAQLVNLPFI